MNAEDKNARPQASPAPNPAPGEKTILTLKSGRMVIMEHAAEENAQIGRLTDMARDGKEEGYAIWSELSACTVNQSGAPGLFICLLTRPSLHAKRAGKLTSLTAVAIARAIEEISDIDVQIGWVNDILNRNKRIASVTTQTQLTASGRLDYAVIGITVALSPDDFPAKLGDVIREVFEKGKTRSLAARLADTIATSFFELYEHLEDASAYLPDYRRRCPQIGRRVRLLRDGKTRAGRVVDADEYAGLIVECKNGEQTRVYSRKELIF